MKESYVETDAKTLVELGEVFYSGGKVQNLWKWYREACDLAREALGLVPDDLVHREGLVKRLKELDSRCIL